MEHKESAQGRTEQSVYTDFHDPTAPRRCNQESKSIRDLHHSSKMIQFYYWRLSRILMHDTVQAVMLLMSITEAMARLINAKQAMTSVST